jgi:hypothetical protein
MYAAVVPSRAILAIEIAMMIALILVVMMCYLTAFAPPLPSELPGGAEGARPRPKHVDSLARFVIWRILVRIIVEDYFQERAWGEISFTSKRA